MPKIRTRLAPEQREDYPLRQFISKLKRRERKNWTNEELLHIVRGYSFAIDAAGVPAERKEQTLRELLQKTHRITLGSELLRGIRKTIRYLRLRKRSWDAYAHLTQYDDLESGFTWLEARNIGLRDNKLEALGQSAAHEGIHYLNLDSSELRAQEVQSSYAFKTQLSPKKQTKRGMSFQSDRKIIDSEKKKFTPQKSRDITEGRITAAVAASIRFRLGNEKAEQFLKLVRNGKRPYFAYLEVRPFQQRPFGDKRD